MHDQHISFFFYLREGAFFPPELKARFPLAFRLPVLLEELKSASLPAREKLQCFEHAIKIEAKQYGFRKGMSYRNAFLSNSTGVLLLKPSDHWGCFWGLNVAAF